ncbi:hypothetical protein [Streptomyces sp. NBC_01244]|uniref:hypothetical protein n=1 Tax=Streptomyces sp. NBC_01244 TaxID=2903797 RepID=UPI002E0D4846|nr:hypothetical protein OG247_43895 [Streptomyces sp. NBC_01244]
MNTQLPVLVSEEAFGPQALEQAIEHVARLVRRAAERDGLTEEDVMGHLTDNMLGAVYLGYLHAERDNLDAEARNDAARRTAYRTLYDNGCPGLAYRTVLRLWGRPRARRRPAAIPAGPVVTAHQIG